MIQIKMGKAVDTDRMRLIAKDAASNETLFLDGERFYIYDHADGKRTLAGPFTASIALSHMGGWTLLPGMVESLERCGVLAPEKKQYVCYVYVDSAEIRVEATSHNEARKVALEQFEQEFKPVIDAGLYYELSQCVEIKGNKDV